MVRSSLLSSVFVALGVCLLGFSLLSVRADAGCTVCAQDCGGVPASNGGAGCIGTCRPTLWNISCSNCICGTVAGPLGGPVECGCREP